MAGTRSYYKQMLGNDDFIAHCLIWDRSAPASGVVVQEVSVKYYISSPGHATLWINLSMFTTVCLTFLIYRTQPWAFVSQINSPTFFCDGKGKGIA